MHDLFVQAVLKRQRGSIQWLNRQTRLKSTPASAAKMLQNQEMRPPPDSQIRINIIKFNALYG
jgi:hypothetical protein